MTDERPQDESPDQFDAEVNDLLAEAESMSAEIADQVGSTPPSGDKREKEFFETETDSEHSLDRQLSQTREAVDAAATELGAAPTKPKKTIALPPKKGAAQAQSADSAPSSDEDGVATQPRAPKTITLPQRPASDADEFVTAERLVAGSLDETPYEVNPSQPGLARKVWSHIPSESLRRAGTASARVAVTTLEALDRPFTWVGYRPRTLLGWLALLLSVGATSLYFFAVR